MRWRLLTLAGALMPFWIHDSDASATPLSNDCCGLNEWPLMVTLAQALRDQPAFFVAFPGADPWMGGSTLDVEFALAPLACRHHIWSIRAYGLVCYMN